MWRNLFILYFVFVKKQRTIERKKKRSKISGLESCYAKKIYVLIGVELRPYGQKLVQFCKHTHTRVSFSIIDVGCSSLATSLCRPRCAAFAGCRKSCAATQLGNIEHFRLLLADRSTIDAPHNRKTLGYD